MNNNVYAYSVDRDQWSKFTEFPIRHSCILTGIEERSNVNIIYNRIAEMLMEYPGTALTTTDATLVTKKYPMLGAKIRRVSLEYEGTAEPVLTVIAYNRRFTGGSQEVSVTISEAGRFYGLNVGYKCDYVQFKVTGAEKIKMIRYTTV